MKKTRRVLAIVLATIMVLTLIPMSAFAADYTIELGETITVTVPAEGYAECKFTPDEDGTYVVYSDSGENDVDPKVDIYDENDNNIADDDDNDYYDTYDFYCIFDAEAGVDYLFEMAEYDGVEAEFDVTVSVFGEITHQPTTTAPYVEVTEGADAEYQWFKVGDIIEVTDENTKEVSYSGNIASYDPEKGWTGIPTGYIDGDYAEYDFFELELKECQTLAMTFDCDMYDFDVECVGECDSYEYFDWDDIEAGETVYFTANHDCYFCCYGDSDTVPVMKVVILDAIKIDGATDAEYNAKEIGEYFCRVTFDGCRIEYSDKIEISESDIIADSHKISKADVNVRTDIAGMNAYDYEDYIEILTKGLEFEDNYGDIAVYVYDSNDNDVYGEFVSGETYRIYLYLTPESGYKFANTVDGTVNGEEVETDVRYWEPGGEYGDIQVDFVEFIFDITVTESCDHICHQDGILGFFWDIANFFCKLFKINPVCECGKAHY